MLTKYYALTDYCAVLIFENSLVTEVFFVLSFSLLFRFFFSFFNVNGNVRFYPAQIFTQETL